MVWGRCDRGGGVSITLETAVRVPGRERPLNKISREQNEDKCASTPF